MSYRDTSDVVGANASSATDDQEFPSASQEDQASQKGLIQTQRDSTAVADRKLPHAYLNRSSAHPLGTR